MVAAQRSRAIRPMAPTRRMIPKPSLSLSPPPGGPPPCLLLWWVTRGFSFGARQDALGDVLDGLRTQEAAQAGEHELDLARPAEESGELSEHQSAEAGHEGVGEEMPEVE